MRIFENRVSPLCGKANFVVGKIHFSTGEPFALFVVEYEYTVKGAVIHAKKTTDAVAVVPVEIQYLLADHNPVCMDEETCRNRIGMFQVQSHCAHNTFGRANHAVVFPLVKQVVKFYEIWYPNGLVGKERYV